MSLDDAAPFGLHPFDAANRELLARVHPPDWVNPTPARRYNLVVVGGGTAGLVAAAGAAGLGAKVALVERGLLGGDCLNVGCVPSKALLRASRVAYGLSEAARYGVRLPDGVRVDFGEAMARMRRLRADLARNDSAERFQGLGVDVFLGAGRFTSRDTVEVNGAQLRFKRAVIATGGKPTLPPIPGLAEAGALTHETVFSLTKLPSTLLVLGAGPVGCELAQAFRRFGAEVVILDRAPRLLPGEDPDASALLAGRFEAEGIRLVLGASLRQVERAGAVRTVTVERGGAVEQVSGDALLVSAGRTPGLAGLGLDRAGVVSHPDGVTVNDRLRTSNPRIFAAGDVASIYRFTHAADALARIALQNALFFGRKRASALVIPWATYTDPEVAHVGLSSEAARARSPAVSTLTVPLEALDRAVLDGRTEGFARFHLEPKKGRVLGATLVSEHAGELIGEVALAMAEGLTAAAFARSIHPYPTQSEMLKRLGDAYNRTRLTPVVKRAMEWFLARMR